MHYSTSGTFIKRGMQCITVQVELLLKEECSALQVDILKNEWIALLIYIFLKEEYSVHNVLFK